MNDFLFRAIQRWLTRPGNSQARLAAMLGYKSSTTISKWIERGTIPQYMHAPLRAALKED